MNEAAQAQNAAGGELSGKIQGPRRQKTWDEMDAGERMQAMREEVRWLRRSVTELENSARRVKHHQHAQDGSLLVPLLDRHDDDRPRGYLYDPLK